MVQRCLRAGRGRQYDCPAADRVLVAETLKLLVRRQVAGAE